MIINETAKAEIIRRLSSARAAHRAVVTTGPYAWDERAGKCVTEFLYGSSGIMIKRARTWVGYYSNGVLQHEEART